MVLFNLRFVTYTKLEIKKTKKKKLSHRKNLHTNTDNRFNHKVSEQLDTL